MANIKISELTVLAPPAAADELVVVDVSAASTKKTTVGEVVGIINGDVEVANNGTATISELPVSKLQDGAARQLLQTDAAGTGVEWASNIDVPGTLDVTGAATFDAAVRVPLGSAASPSLTFTGDTNTGIYSPGADKVAISTGGSGRLFVDANGNVGVGLTSPSTTLSIGASASSSFDGGVCLNRGPSGYNFYEASDGTNSVIFGLDHTLTVAKIGSINSYPVGFFTGNTERFRCDSSGRLLIGASSESGGALLQVNGDRIRVGTAKTPASATATGTAGEICWDADYIYVCTAANTWKRTAITTW